MDYQGRSVLVTDGDVANSSKALERFLAQNNVIREWRMSFRHRQKGEERRKLKSVRWRRRFKYEVSCVVTYRFAGHAHLTCSRSRSARKSSLFSKYGDEGHKQFLSYPYDDYIPMNNLVTLLVFIDRRPFRSVRWYRWSCGECLVNFHPAQDSSPINSDFQSYRVYPTFRFRHQLSSECDYPQLIVTL